MAIAISSRPARRAQCAFYDVDPRSGETIEIFYADALVAQSFGAHAAGWYWRYRQPDLSVDVPVGPFLVCLGSSAQRNCATLVGRLCVVNRKSANTHLLAAVGTAPGMIAAASE